MSEFVTMEMINAIVEIIQSKTSKKPIIGMILGSGLGSLANEVKNPDIIPYSELPNWPISTIEGHIGQLVIGEFEGKTVVVMQGRTHFYEGYSMSFIGLPVRVMQKLGVETMIITNAAGAVNPDFSPGDLMLITDHNAMLLMAGQNPLRGPNLDEFGPRFPDMSKIYTHDLAELARSVAKDAGMILREGVYICLSGPCYETPADLRFLHSIGVDAVGMSTVPEATIAAHGGVKVLGISGISNKANLDGSTETTHEEVLEAGKILVPKLTELVKGVLGRI